ncbi:hypothetical protein M433DRAFT_139484 [Acidomyces richmondensis BFW]|nr:MAG: hypothetical protein FE78DRAFT_78494 [Acidomyces sp. 'richmondensis']KYG50058.1 hypothetical protein M433DRAFT_139484 [Acidomyces richmondensis BFW]
MAIASHGLLSLPALSAFAASASSRPDRREERAWFAYLDKQAKASAVGTHTNHGKDISQLRQLSDVHTCSGMRYNGLSHRQLTNARYRLNAQALF